MAPEQAKGAVADARSDIYSLGIVMYEMLTGQLPYTGETPEEIAIKHINGNPVPEKPCELNPGHSGELEQIVLKAMSADLQGRYQSASDMLADLEGFRNETKYPNFTLDYSNQQASDQYPSGYIIAQSPDADSTAKVGTTIKLTVSTGPETNTMPDLVNKSEASAKSYLDKMAIQVVVSVSYEQNDDYTDGYVIRTDPRRPTPRSRPGRP
jgi:serine/threonine-protein kinase